MCMRQNSNSSEVGFGINCEAISSNCIVLFEESRDMDKLPNDHVQDNSANLNQHNIDEVPVTPFDKMAMYPLGFWSLLHT